MRKRIFKRLVLLAGIAIAGFLLLVWTTISPVNEENFQRLKNHMSHEEVTGILGGRFDGFDQRRLRKASYIADISFAETGGRHVEQWRQWDGNGQSIVVGFDQAGSVLRVFYFRYPDSLLDQFRRWLRLS